MACKYRVGVASVRTPLGGAPADISRTSAESAWTRFAIECSLPPIHAIASSLVSLFNPSISVMRVSAELDSLIYSLGYAGIETENGRFGEGFSFQGLIR